MAQSSPRRCVQHGRPERRRAVGRSLYAAGFRMPGGPWVHVVDSVAELAAVRRHHVREITAARREYEQLVQAAAAELAAEATAALDGGHGPRGAR